MPGPLEEWRRRYREAIEQVEGSVDVLTGFNANIDVIHTEFDIREMDPELPNEISTKEELQSGLNYCLENDENREVDYSDLEIAGGEEKIGGQGGIMSNFLAGTGNPVIFYTPYLSSELADRLNEKILYPTEEEGDFCLKNIDDAVNSQRTKKNHIFEYGDDRTGRLILSSSLKGFGPYFSAEVERNLDLLESNVDCCILSGFHDAAGNVSAKLGKAASQLSRIDVPVHVEYAHNEKNCGEILEKVIPQADSLGLDETELEEILDQIGINEEKPFNFGEAFSMLKKLMEKLKVSRIHLHTYRYHICVTEKDYRIEKEKIREGMLYGELSAIQLADKGRIPDTSDIRDFEPEYSMNGVEQLREFGKYSGLDGFEWNGVAELGKFKVVGIPVLVHDDPERTVGMGDIISSGAFSSEFRNFD